MVAKIENNPFAGQAFDPIDDPYPEEEVETAEPAEKKDDLPFDE